MGDIYTTFHPETGELTKETEFINSWKWNDDRKGFEHYTHQQKSLVSKYQLPRDTTVEVVEIIVGLTESKEHLHRQLDAQRKIEYELLEALETASYQIKELNSKEKQTKKKRKNFLIDIAKYLLHTEDCSVTTMKIVGRAKIKSKCTCGLSKILSSVK
tara:strand:+ start:1475 stop:1948 length:474 start_codon:yes stop_codon:yes gene_type:complete